MLEGQGKEFTFLQLENTLCSFARGWELQASAKLPKAVKQRWFESSVRLMLIQG